MRETQKVSVWPVGLAGGLMVEMPVLDPKTGRVNGWNSAWRPERPFPLDMAGFAINLSLFLKHPDAKFSFNVARGYQESEILRHLTTPDQLEPKADNCTKVSSTSSLCGCSRCSMLFSCGNKFVIQSSSFGWFLHVHGSLWWHHTFVLM